MKHTQSYSAALLKYYKTTEFNSWGRDQPFAGLSPEEHYSISKYLGTRRCSTMDMGTGGGRVALALAEMGFTPIYGYDFVPELVEVARANATTLSVNVRFEVGNALSVPLPDNTVEIAIYWEKLLSLIVDLNDRLQAISEAFRVLSQGGFLFASYNQFSSRSINGVLKTYMKIARYIARQRLPERSLPILRRGGKPSLRALLPRADNPHAYWHHIDEAVWELTSLGFRVIELFFSAGYRQNKSHDYNSLKKGTLYVVAQKPE
jgi:SAM-dependent methyltransferase